MATPLEKRFKKAVWLIRNGPPKAGTSNDEKLKFYGLFKQATEGDCTAPQPWAVQKYIDLVAEGDLSWESHEALKDYREEEA
ncbi:hypothetical protein CHLNCDRAFT_135252 [Chlorella variabilis]|uniref:ACB domain-containing protein n=1 Tax=Chlorella variabilis TaxID=554065 RepID=E1ZHT9_CHLVA|nr:hypothetical protein CHLNCDRAFT_135252 [Chlorella variabilis]EFN54520.1 hypothetical protein CHLNCDRAFT_135252 [Chlorella variabilis]|eukprot:XP_005846622.1 hypothetical protein CHLNCDRAFT_135252 [Chlorella variabilis]